RRRSPSAGRTCAIRRKLPDPEPVEERRGLALPCEPREERDRSHGGRDADRLEPQAAADRELRHREDEPGDSSAPDTTGDEERSAAEDKALLGRALEAALHRPIRELRDQQQARSIDGRVAVDRALADDEERGVFRPREREGPGEQPLETAGERDDEEQ